MDTYAKAKILIVDDMNANLIAMRNILQDFDADLVTVTNGPDAVSKALNDDFALILMDVQMPDFDGFETAEMLRRNENSRFTPIIFVTAHGRDDHHKFKGYEAGAVDYLYKPLETILLRSKVSIFLDIHNKKVELQRSNTALQEFAYLAAHDLKTPIRQILNWGNMLEEDHEQGNREEFLANIENLKKSANRMNQLVKNLLSFAEVGAGPIKFCEMALDSIVQDVIDEFRNVIIEHGIEINLFALPVVSCSSLLMHQLMQNLIGNAIKYRDTDRKLVIQIQPLKNPQNNKCSFMIQDNGTGFKKSYADRIFLPFKRLVSSTQVEGSGIGLATVKKIIDLHRGYISAEGEPGQGARFTIELPVQRI